MVKYGEICQVDQKHQEFDSQEIDLPSAVRRWPWTNSSGTTTHGKLGLGPSVKLDASVLVQYCLYLRKHAKALCASASSKYLILSYIIQIYHNISKWSIYILNAICRLQSNQLAALSFYATVWGTASECVLSSHSGVRGKSKNFLSSLRAQ
jgi:hypothetical protein